MPEPNFNPVARIYRWAEYLALGPLLTRVRNHFLPRLTGTRGALLLGDGDGRFTARLLHAAPVCTAIAVDASPAMLHLLRARCRFASHRLTTLHASVPHSLPPPGVLHSTDLVVSHFFLDCLSTAEVHTLARQLTSHLQTGCLWLVSDFALPPQQPWRTLGTLYVRALYRAFRILTGLRAQHLPDHHAALHAAGFYPVAHKSFAKGLLFTELWELQLTPFGATSPPAPSSTQR